MSDESWEQMRKLIQCFMDEQHEWNRELEKRIRLLETDLAVTNTKVLFYGSAASIVVGLITHIILGKLK